MAKKINIHIDETKNSVKELTKELKGLSKSFDDFVKEFISQSEKGDKQVVDFTKNISGLQKAVDGILDSKRLETFKEINKRFKEQEQNLNQINSLLEKRKRLGLTKDEIKQLTDRQKTISKRLGVEPQSFFDNESVKYFEEQTSSLRTQSSLVRMAKAGEERQKGIGGLKGASLFAVGSIEMAMAQLALKGIELVQKFIKEIKQEVIKSIKEVSSYALSESYIVNSQARQQALTYGLSDAQNYAFTQAKSILGISSDEDLYYMNQNQREMMSYLMKTYSNLYEEMSNNGSLVEFQKMQIELKVMKAELSSTIVKFIAEHKDLIVNVFEQFLSFTEYFIDWASGLLNAISYIITPLEYISQAVSSVVNWLSGENANDNWSDYISNQTTMSNSVNTNNTFNLNTNAYASSNNSNELANSIATGTLASLKTYFNS